MLLDILNKDFLKEIEKIEIESFNEPWSSEIYSKLLEKNYNKIYVKYESKVIVAFLLVMETLDEIEILKIAVSKNYRRRGFSKELLKELMESSRKDIFLEVRVGNSIAINLYKKMGFIEIGKRKNYYRDTNEDALVLKLEKDGSHEKMGI